MAGDSIEQQKDSEILLPSSRKRYSSNTSFNGAKIVEFKPTLSNSSEEGRGLGESVTMCGILDQLKVVTSAVECRRNVEKNGEEWERMSKCFDWFFFVLFVCLFLLTSLYFLVPAYLNHAGYV